MCANMQTSILELELVKGDAGLKDKVCIIIPIYKSKFNKKEERAVINNYNKLKGMCIYFIAPDGLNTYYYQKMFPKIKFVYFKKTYFKNIAGYNRLMLLKSFYNRFTKYKYMLVCQPDVWLIKGKEELIRFCKLDMSYIGAPWIPYYLFHFLNKRDKQYMHKFGNTKLYIGNGGLSLRKIGDFKEILDTHFILSKIWIQNEDLFYSYFFKKNSDKYRIPDVETAKMFSLETECKKIMNKERIIPFGVHGYDKNYKELPGLACRGRV